MTGSATGSATKAPANPLACYTARVADACVLIPVVNAAHVTPHSEAFQAVVWHLLVSHPDLKQEQTKWESVV